MLQLLKSLGEALNGLLEPSHPLRQELAASRSAIPLKATNNHTRAIHDAVAAAYDACSPPAIHTIASDTKLDASASAETFVEKQRRLNQRKPAIDSVRRAVDVVGKELVVDSTIYGQVGDSMLARFVKTRILTRSRILSVKMRSLSCKIDWTSFLRCTRSFTSAIQVSSFQILG